MSATACPASGIHPDVPAAEYHAWDAASNSRLNVLQRSAAHLRHEIGHPSPPSDAQVLGDAVHYAVLQPDLFGVRYACAPECDRRTKAGKETWEAFAAENVGRTVLKRDDHTLCLALRDAVRAHPLARSLLAAAAAHREVSLVWTDEESGVTCKARADLAAPAAAIVADLKTTTDASPGAFGRSVFNFGYHRQAAHYMNGFRALGIDVSDFLFIAVEKSPPHCVAVYRIDDDALEAGRHQLRGLLKRYHACTTSGAYPGYGDDILSLSLPAWAYSQLDG